MGIRPSSGGFLNGVDVTLKDYAWQAKAIEGKNGVFTPYNLELQLLVDGADEPVKTWLKLGNGEDGWGDGSNISEDGKRLFSDRSPGSQSGVGVFLNSFKAAGYTENFADDMHDDYLTLEAFLARGPRFRVIQEVNEEKTKKFGQQTSRKDATKKFDRRDFKVEKFYGFTKEGVTGAKKATNGSGKAIEPSTDVKGTATDTLVELLQASGDKCLKRSQLRVKAITKLAKHPQRNEVVKAIELMAQVDGPKWTYHATEQVVELIPF